MAGSTTSQILQGARTSRLGTPVFPGALAAPRSWGLASFTVQEPPANDPFAGPRGAPGAVPAGGGGGSAVPAGLTYQEPGAVDGDLPLNGNIMKLMLPSVCGYGNIVSIMLPYGRGDPSAAPLSW